MYEGSILSTSRSIDAPSLMSPSWQNKIKQNSKNGNLNREISYENEQLNTPEQLDMERRALKVEIAKLKKELQPLQEEFNQLTQAHESKRNLEDVSMTEVMSSELTQMRLEDDQLKDQLAKLRRFYSQATQKRLEDEIKGYRELLAQLNEETAAMKNILYLKSKELSDVLSSSTASTIKEQELTINSLLYQRSRLETVENEMVQRHLEESDQTQTIQNQSKQIEALKRKYAQVEKQRMQASLELRKMRAEKEQIIQELKKQIEAKKKMMNETKKKELWRTFVNTDTIRTPQTGKSPRKGSTPRSPRPQPLPALAEPGSIQTTS